MLGWDEALPLLIVLLIWVGIEIVIINRHKALIRDSLESRKAKVIKISWKPLDFDESNHTYSVEYTQPDGSPMSRQCKIHMWGSTLYWEE